jgi:uncharacterized protein with HEPN domain
MRRNVATYLADILEACDAIDAVLEGVTLDEYLSTRSIRSSVEREFIIIGEAIGGIKRLEPDLFESISDAKLIVGFRNVLTHDYAGVDDEAVFGVAVEDVPQLRRECSDLLERVGGAD